MSIDTFLLSSMQKIENKLPINNETLTDGLLALSAASSLLIMEERVDLAMTAPPLLMMFMNKVEPDNPHTKMFRTNMRYSVAAISALYNLWFAASYLVSPETFDPASYAITNTYINTFLAAEYSHENSR